MVSGTATKQKYRSAYYFVYSSRPAYHIFDLVHIEDHFSVDVFFTV